MRSPAHPLRVSGLPMQWIAWCIIALGLAAGCTRDPSLPPSEKQLTTMLVQASSLDREEMRDKLRAGCAPGPGYSRTRIIRASNFDTDNWGIPLRPYLIPNQFLLRKAGSERFRLRPTPCGIGATP